MRPLAYGIRMQAPAESRPTDHARLAASQALSEPTQDALGGARRDTEGRSEGVPAFVLADYCEPHHCDPPREDPTEPLLRTLEREVLLGTW